MRCPKCGTENPHGRVLCVKCGTRLRTAAAVAGSSLATPEAAALLMQRLRADLRRIVVVTAVVIGVAIVLGTILR